ncbi:hypothetical protein KIN20_026058 [Parelaphostrongylus tenuis]|uniref:Uncharacterized protein n=1 Tax=Parelaphostrongylus tenuis TaxID=148309 RepID=A0AAD5MW95_PARTN|nr:hypothetical protein KIN20_026058 [Parelaphostrongylus tenuis]
MDSCQYFSFNVIICPSCAGVIVARKIPLKGTENEGRSQRERGELERIRSRAAGDDVVYLSALTSVDEVRVSIGGTCQKKESSVGRIRASQRSHRPITDYKLRANLFDSTVLQRFVMQRRRELILRPRQDYTEQLTEHLNDVF